MTKRKLRPKSPPSDRELDAMANKIVAQIVEADQAGLNYISPLIDGEISLADLFDRHFSVGVRNRVYRKLELEEQLRKT